MAIALPRSAFGDDNYDDGDDAMMMINTTFFVNQSTFAAIFNSDDLRKAP